MQLERRLSTKSKCSNIHIRWTQTSDAISIKCKWGHKRCVPCSRRWSHSSSEGFLENSAENNKWQKLVSKFESWLKVVILFLLNIWFDVNTYEYCFSINLILIPLLLLIYYKVRNWEMVNCKIEIQFFGLSMKTNIRTMSVWIKLFLCFCLGWALSVRGVIPFVVAMRALIGAGAASVASVHRILLCSPSDSIGLAPHRYRTCLCRTGF